MFAHPSAGSGHVVHHKRPKGIIGSFSTSPFRQQWSYIFYAGGGGRPTWDDQ